MLFGPIELVRQTERVGMAMASYAFDRATRVELQGGVSRLTFERFTAFSDRDGWESAAPTMTLGTAGVALVRDTTSHGAMSVVRGERYRLEAAPTFGTIRYVNLLADYRRYVMPVPFYTIAARALHFGRYGGGADDTRIPPLYLGYPSLVRGYDLDAAIEDQCVVPLARACASIDRMVGSRIAVGNIEFRFPLLRPFGVSRSMYGPEAVEIAFFVDGGLVWRGSTTAAARVDRKCLEHGYHAAYQPRRTRPRPVRHRPSVPKSGNGLGVPVQPGAGPLSRRPVDLAAPHRGAARACDEGRNDMRGAVLIVMVALGSAVGCTDNPVSPSAVGPSAVPGRRTAFRNRLVYRPESGNPCAPFFFDRRCGCYVPCGQVRPPSHLRTRRP